MQYYWPVSSDKMVTAWIPLQDVPPEMGPLEFAAGSQRQDLGRELNISGDNERRIGEVGSFLPFDITLHYIPIHYTTLQ